MTGYWPILKRELFSFFVTPLAWVLVFVFVVLQGLHFGLLIDHFASVTEVTTDQSPLQAFFGNTVLLYVVLFLLVPPITMGAFAEERRSGTAETLLTAPVGTVAVVLAKYTAALVAYVAMWLPTTLYVVILRRAGEVDVGVAAACYLGVLLVGAAYLSIGVFMSALTTSQFLALVMTALVVLGFFVLGIGEFVTAPGSVLNGVAHHVSVWAAMTDFASGIVDARHLVVLGSLVVVPLFLAVRAVDAWRWGGR